MSHSRVYWALGIVGLVVLYRPAWGDPVSPPAAPAVASPSPSASASPVHWLVGTLPGIDTVRLEHDLVHLRGLSFKRTVQVSARHQDDLHAMLQAGAHSNEEGNQTESATLAAFGFTQPGFDVGETAAKLTENVIQGFYDLTSKQFYLCVDNIKPPPGLDGELFAKVGFTSEMMVSTHELDHALQDQYYDLGKVHHKATASGNSDQALAVKALIEGEANWVMYAALFERMGQPPTAMPNLTRLQENAESSRPLYRAGNIPPYLRRTLFFPYIEGVGFVHELRRLGLGWDLVNKAWEDPPDSTQQILHPFLYVGERRFPTSVAWNSLPKAMGDWKQVDEDTLGEYESIVLFDTLAGEAPAHRAVAAGWLGDRYRTYVNGDKTAVIWYSTWKDAGTASDVEKLMEAAWSGRRFGTVPSHVELLGSDVLATRGLTSDELASIHDPVRDVAKKVESHPVLVHLTESEIYDREQQASKVQIDQKKMAALFPASSVRTATDYHSRGDRYQSDAAGFSIGTRDWAFAQTEANGVTMVMGSSPDHTRSLVISTLLMASSLTVPLDQLGEGVESGFKRGLTDYQHLSAADVTLQGGIPARQLDVSGTSSTSRVPLRVRIYVVATRTGVVSLIFMSPPTQWSRTLPVVERTMDTLVVQR